MPWYRKNFNFIVNISRFNVYINSCVDKNESEYFDNHYNQQNYELNYK